MLKAGNYIYSHLVIKISPKEEHISIITPSKGEHISINPSKGEHISIVSTR